MSGKILFVCLGNICRSPLAEGIFTQLVRERGLADKYRVDSAGTGDWHVGQPPDRRSIAVAQKRGVTLPSLCRQIRREDFQEFDWILAMDKLNRSDLQAMCPPTQSGKLKLMRDFEPTAADRGSDVPDPYYGGPYEFDSVYQMLHRCCMRLLDSLEGGGARPAESGDGAAS
jgi:protein-tyrosine phosphatase